MNIRYHPETDMLYIELTCGVSTESEEVAPGIVLDYDQDNRVIGIELDHAAKRTTLSEIKLTTFPTVVPPVVTQS
ncbi:MAG: DUF2283 domain-containing protein [Chloroflexi bacterium]|nr:DUF2283 domain-containing protein [Chloroflexota bacterium]MDA1218767.1 DUF2283 domain-containing protein [Chloroflexota bacterium]